MVKLARGGRRQVPPGRPEPKPLFPPGKLPVFGPPPANPRGPPHPRHRMPYGMPPRPPPPLMRPLPMGPPMPPPPPPMRGPPPPLMGPLMGPLGMPPRPPHFMERRRRGGPMGGMRPWMGPPTPMKRLNNKNFKRGKKRNNQDESFEDGECCDQEESYEDEMLGSNDSEGSTEQSMKMPQEDSEEFFCEACDRGFQTAAAFSSHMAAHKKCDVEGCNFSAHPAVVLSHFKMQHKTGLFSRLKTSDAEEWIKQRKRNFPTQANIERKALEKEESEKRGEVLNCKTRIQHNRSNVQRNFTHPRNKFERRKLITQTINRGNKSNFSKSSAEYQPAVAVIKSLSENDIIAEDTPDQDWSEDELEPLEKPVVKTTENATVLKPSQMNSSLGSLMASYDSDICSDTDAPPSCAPKEDGETSSPEEVPIKRAREEPIELKQPEREPPKRQFGRGRNRGHPRGRRNVSHHHGKMHHKPNLPSQKSCSLLEMLLKDDIRKERNQILQCIRYIVDNNFFDEPPKSTERNHGALEPAADVAETAIIDNDTDTKDKTIDPCNLDIDQCQSKDKMVDDSSKVILDSSNFSNENSTIDAIVNETEDKIVSVEHSDDVTSI